MIFINKRLEDSVKYMVKLGECVMSKARNKKVSFNLYKQKYHFLQAQL